MNYTNKKNGANWKYKSSMERFKFWFVNPGSFVPQDDGNKRPRLKWHNFMKILSWITGLRGLAAIVVVLYHLNQHRSTVDLSPFSWGLYQLTEHLVLVVSVFFMLGGLLRSLSYWKVILLGEERVPRLLPAIVDRFNRIAPMYYLALAASFILVIIFQWYSGDGFFRLIAGFSFLSWISPVTFFPVEINGPLWFIAYDMMGWLLVSLVMMWATRIKKTSLPIYFVGIIWFLLFAHFVWIHLPWTPTSWVPGEWFPTYNPFLFGLHFLAGALAGGVIIWLNAKKIPPQYIFDGIALISFVMLIIFLWNIREVVDWGYSWPHGPYHFPISTILLSVLLITLPFTRYIGRCFDNLIFRFFAMISYPLYLFHMLVIILLRKYVFFWEQLPLAIWSIFGVCTFVIAWFLAWILHRIFKRKRV